MTWLVLVYPATVIACLLAAYTSFSYFCLLALHFIWLWVGCVPLQVCVWKIFGCEFFSWSGRFSIKKVNNIFKFDSYQVQINRFFGWWIRLPLINCSLLDFWFGMNYLVWPSFPQNVKFKIIPPSWTKSPSSKKDFLLQCTKDNILA